MLNGLFDLSIQLRLVIIVNFFMNSFLQLFNFILIYF